MGEQDETFRATLGEYEKNFGVPGKPVRIEQPFYLGITEVTYEQYDYYIWQQRVSDAPVTFPATAKGGRLGGERCLPTEAEWEYAARADTQTAYPWGDDPGSNNANCNGCGSSWDYETQKVNSHSIYSMAYNAY